MTLPENIDATYLDRSAGDAAHQQHHDEIHSKLNSPAANWTEGNAAYVGKAGVAASGAEVLTGETTTSTTYTDLATAGPAVTADVGPLGIAIVVVSAWLKASSAGNAAKMGFAVSGGNTLAAADSRTFSNEQTVYVAASYTQVLLGLTAGSTTFTAKYAVSAGTGTFVNRRIQVYTL